MNTNYIEEKDVTTEVLKNLFKSAFIKVLDIDDVSFDVHIDVLDSKIMIDDERKNIRFSIFFPIDDKPYEESIFKSNEYNSTHILIRYFVEKYQDTTYWVADYTMSYEMGVIPFQVVNNARIFNRFVTDTAREFLNSKQ